MADITVKNPSEFLQEARDRFALGLKDVKEDHEAGKACIQFIHGGEGQWSQEALALRRKPNRPPRPVITWNVLQEPVNQVVNDCRAMNPSIQVTALDTGDPERAEIIQSRIRAIEYESDADIAYDTSAQHQVINGFGFYRVRTDYKDFKSFDQKIIIEELQNQFASICDTAASKYDKSDADWWFLCSRISQKAFIGKYGQKAYDGFRAFDGGGDNWTLNWNTGDELVPEVEYWHREWVDDELYRITWQGKKVDLLGRELKKYGLLADGNFLIYKRDGDGLLPIEIPIIQQRKTQVPEVKQYIISGSDVLDEHEWLGTIIPVIPVYGPQLIVDGRRRTKGLIADALDPQRMINFTISKIAELTQNISNVKATVVEGQLIGHEDEWQPDSQLLYRQYKLYDAQNRPLPPPVHDESEPPVQALLLQLGQSIDAVKKATSIYSASLGDRSNETSGKAINARKIESDSANFHFPDNQARSRKKLGRILLELIPAMDAQQEYVDIRHEDGSVEVIPVGKEFAFKNKQVKYAPGSGIFNIGVRTGPSYTSQREQKSEILLDMAQKDPNLMTLAGDEVYRGIPGCEAIADRYHDAVIPEQFRKQKDGAQPLPPEAVQAIKQYQQNAKALNEYCVALEKQLQEAMGKLDSKRMEIESREKIAAIQADVDKFRIQMDVEKSAAQLASKDYLEEIKLAMQTGMTGLQARIDELYAERGPQAQPPAPSGVQENGQ